MGYTHYFTFNEIKYGDTDKVNNAFLKAVRECAKVAKSYNNKVEGYARLSGYTAHTPIGRYGGIEINGKGDAGHESFNILEHYKDNIDVVWSFCKTAKKPYDVVVVACLCILKHRLKSYINIGSDGDDTDWKLGCQLANYTLGLKIVKIPKSIRKAKPRLVTIQVLTK